MRKILILILNLIIILIFSSYAFGADYNIDKALEFAQNFTSSDALDTILNYARSLFIGLAALSFAYGLIRMLFNGESNLGTVFSLLARFILYCGIFIWIINNDVPQTIINSFIAIGSKVKGVDALTPDNIMSAGIRIYGNIIEQSWNAGWGNFTGVIFLGLIILVASALIAGLFALALIEMHLVICGGVILLGFAGFIYTRDIALSYIKYAISVGIKLLMVMIIYNFASSTIIDWEASFSKAADMGALITSSGQILGGVICILLAVYYAPKEAQAIVNKASMTLGLPTNQVMYANINGANVPVEIRRNNYDNPLSHLLDSIRGAWSGRYNEASGRPEITGGLSTESGSLLAVDREYLRNEEGMISGAGYRPLAAQGGAKIVKNAANAEAMTNYIQPDNAYVNRERMDESGGNNIYNFNSSRRGDAQSSWQQNLNLNNANYIVQNLNENNNLNNNIYNRAAGSSSQNLNINNANYIAQNLDKNNNN